MALVTPRSGAAGMFGLQCLAAAELAAAEIDSRGGVASRHVEYVHIDAGRSPAAVGAHVAALARAGEIDAVTGWHLSNTRQAITTALAGSLPYVYSAAYEGGETSEGVICSGEVPGDQIISALKWFRGERRLRRWFVIGNDYIWPRGTAHATRVGLIGTDIEVVGTRFIPLDTEDESRWYRACSEIAASGADGVLSLLVGSDAVRFNRAFAAHGLDAALTRFSPFTDETVVMASGTEATVGLFISAGWFASLGTASAGEFNAGFRRSFDLLHGTGPLGISAAPPPGTMAETTYSGVHVLANMASASVPTVADTRRAYTASGWDSPHGPVDLRDGAARHRVHLAAADGVSLDIVDRVS